MTYADRSLHAACTLGGMSWAMEASELLGVEPDQMVELRAWCRRALALADPGGMDDWERAASAQEPMLREELSLASSKVVQTVIPVLSTYFGSSHPAVEQTLDWINVLSAIADAPGQSLPKALLEVQQAMADRWPSGVRVLIDDVVVTPGDAWDRAHRWLWGRVGGLDAHRVWPVAMPYMAVFFFLQTRSDQMTQTAQVWMSSETAGQWVVSPWADVSREIRALALTRSGLAV